MDQTQPTQLDPRAQMLTHAIALAENGGQINHNSSGASGEHGAYQFMPQTWKLYAKQTLGDENAPMTSENQNKVAYTKVKGWLDSGHSPAEVAAMWNAGEAKSQAWDPNKKWTINHDDGTATILNGWKGVNSQGVKFDTPAYVKNVQRYGQTLEQHKTQGQPGTTPLQGGVAGAVEGAVSGVPHDQSLLEKLSSRASDLVGNSEGEKDYDTGLSKSAHGLSTFTGGIDQIMNGNGWADKATGVANAFGRAPAQILGTAGHAIGDVTGAALKPVVDIGLGAAEAGLRKIGFPVDKLKADLSNAGEDVLKSAPVSAVLGAAQEINQKHPALTGSVGDAMGITMELIPAIKMMSALKNVFMPNQLDDLMKTGAGSKVQQVASANGITDLKANLLEQLNKSGIALDGKDFNIAMAQKPLAEQWKRALLEEGSAAETTFDNAMSQSMVAQHVLPDAAYEAGASSGVKESVKAQIAMQYAHLLETGVASSAHPWLDLLKAPASKLLPNALQIPALQPSQKIPGLLSRALLTKGAGSVAKSAATLGLVGLANRPK